LTATAKPTIGVEVNSPKLVIVGTCASGKSTLAAALREAGIDASACAQEHSEIPTLWNHTKPDVVVFLDVDLATIRARRSPTWPQTIYDAQRRRLENARSIADVIIETGAKSVDESVAVVLQHMNHMQTKP
jgi:energy-coupling factor transporter ATP-binding protein EcfA2